MSTTVQAAVAKWARNTAASSESVKQGVQAVTESPMAKAAAASDRYVQGVQNAVSSGKYQAGLMSVSLQSWKDSVITKGIPRMQQGIQSATPKVTSFMQQFLPYVQSAAAQVQSMPKGGVENGIARAAAMIRATSQFKYQKS